MFFFRINALGQIVAALVLLMLADIACLDAITARTVGEAILMGLAAAFLLFLSIGAGINGVRVYVAWFRVHFGWRRPR